MTGIVSDPLSRAELMHAGMAVQALERGLAG